MNDVVATNEDVPAKKYVQCIGKLARDVREKTYLPSGFLFLNH